MTEPAFDEFGSGDDISIEGGSAVQGQGDDYGGGGVELRECIEDG